LAFGRSTDEARAEEFLARDIMSHDVTSRDAPILFVIARLDPLVPGLVITKLNYYVIPREGAVSRDLCSLLAMKLLDSAPSRGMTAGKFQAMHSKPDTSGSSRRMTKLETKNPAVLLRGFC
jgi:hypothetical protein